MINRVDTSGTHQQMVSHFTAFSKARKVHSEDQRPDSKQAPDQHLEDNRGDGTSSSDSSETRDPIAHKSDSGSDSLEAPTKPVSKRPRKRQREHTSSTSSSEGYSHSHVQPKQVLRWSQLVVHLPPPPLSLPNFSVPPPLPSCKQAHHCECGSSYSTHPSAGNRECRGAVQRLWVYHHPRHHRYISYMYVHVCICTVYEKLGCMHAEKPCGN